MNTKGFLRKITGSAMALAVAFLMMPAINVHAASEYTVTFRPGNVGRFGLVSDSEKSAKEMAQEVADVLYGGSASVTENGAIKVRVAAGADIPAAPAYIIPNEGYCVRNWGPAPGGKVTKNVDYVVDYGRLTDGVEYTIEYVDEQSGDSIAPFLTAYANIGDSISINAPLVITTSGAGVYELKSDVSAEIILKEDASLNVITFRYAYNYDPGTVTTEIITNIPGDTVTTTENYTTYIDNGAVLTPAPAQGGVQNGVLDNEPAEEPDIVEIEDEETPLADSVDGEGEDGSAPEITAIEDEEVPLANLETSGGFNVTVIWAGALGAAAIALAIVWLHTRKKESEEDGQQ